MIYPENRKLLSIKQMAHACGISRATLLRMEECGFLTPYYIDSETGYRYYDTQNVTTVGQFLRLQYFGLSRSEIVDVYLERVDSHEFLKTQRQRLSIMNQFLDEYELRHDHSRDFTFSYRILPAMTCYTVHVSAESFTEFETKCFLVYEECLQAGYQVINTEPLFMVYRNPGLTPASEQQLDFINCVPVVPGPERDPHLRTFPASDAFSITGFGNYSGIMKHQDSFFKEIKARGIEPSGPVRFIAHVAPYVGEHYQPEDFCYEFVVPIKERTE